MADDTPNIGTAVGASLEALPIDKMIAAPLIAAQKGQVALSSSYADFIERVGMDKDGHVKTVVMKRREAQVDAEGKIIDYVEKFVEVPLLALVSHPNLNVEDISISFEMTISTSLEQHSSTEAQGGFEAKIGWGPFSVTMHGSVAHKDEQTRKTDTRAKYSINVTGKRAGPPEGMMRILDYLINEACTPKQTAGAKLPPPTTP